METMTFERDKELPGLATITLNRPEKLNPISLRAHAEMQDICRELNDDAETRVVIVTGAGRAFSAGADLGSVPKGGEPRRPPGRGQWQSQLGERINSTAGNRSSAAIEGLDQVTIGAVNGLAVGGAVVWLACMDMRLCAESAWFSIPEVQLEIPLTWNALPRLIRELGPARTKELVMACERFTSAQAERWGFVNHVVPDGEVVKRARDLAKRLLSMDPMAIALTKSTCNALANLMVPAEATHMDRDYLMLARTLRQERG